MSQISPALSPAWRAVAPLAACCTALALVPLPVRGEEPEAPRGADFECWEPGAVWIHAGWYRGGQSGITYDMQVARNVGFREFEGRELMVYHASYNDQLSFSEYQRLRRMDALALVEAAGEFPEQFSSWLHQEENGELSALEEGDDGDPDFQSSMVYLPAALVPGSTFEDEWGVSTVVRIEDDSDLPWAEKGALLIERLEADDDLEGGKIRYRTETWFGRGRSVVLERFWEERPQGGWSLQGETRLIHFLPAPAPGEENESPAGDEARGG